MNIARLLLSGFLTATLIAGCGSDGGGTVKPEAPATGGAALAGCVTGSTTDSTCQGCFKSKCKAEVEECYGKGYSGGARTKANSAAAPRPKSKPARSSERGAGGMGIFLPLPALPGFFARLSRIADAPRAARPYLTNR